MVCQGHMVTPSTQSHICERPVRIQEAKCGLAQGVHLEIGPQAKDITLWKAWVGKKNQLQAEKATKYFHNERIF